MIKQTTAILLFSRTAAAESCYKPISSNGIANNKMWDFLYKKTLRTLHGTGLPIIVCNEQHQAGNTFGDKMANALSAGFANGYDNLIVVGSDCVDLTKSAILSTYHKINSTEQFVLGPDCRGGVYVFAINKSVFDKRVFADFAWQTSQLFRQLKKYADNFSLSLLPRLSDINTEDDIRSAFNKFSTAASWRILLSQIIATGILHYNFFIFPFKLLHLNSNKPLRAPPSF
jgi:hypothetical protein